MKEAFVDGVLLDGRQDMVPQKDRVVLVEDGKITGIVDKEDKETYQDFQIIDLQGAYLMPGLVNLHVHLAGSGKTQKEADRPGQICQADHILRAYACGRSCYGGKFCQDPTLEWNDDDPYRGRNC